MSCDGVPFFKDKNAASGWVCILHDENAPFAVARSPQHSHMVALVPSTYKTETKEGIKHVKRLVEARCCTISPLVSSCSCTYMFVGARLLHLHCVCHLHTLRRDPPSLGALHQLLVDNFLVGQDTGFPTTDHSKPRGHHERIFWMKVVLLFIIGDYPGLGKMANMLHSGRFGCHWCMHSFNTYTPGNLVALGNRRHCPQTHPIRKDHRFDQEEERLAPKTRTHSATTAKAQEIEDFVGTKKGKETLQKTSGIYGVNLFSLLLLFDVIWDMLPDMMHNLKGLWERWLMPAFKGEKLTSPPTKPLMTYIHRGKSYEYTAEEQKQRKAAYALKKKRYVETKRVNVAAYGCCLLLLCLNSALVLY